jgi:hypothetical protein
MQLSESEILTKKWEKRPPIVIGPRGFQLIDNHHHARSLFDSQLANSEKWLYVRVHRNWHTMALDKFDYAMVTENFIWPYDQRGVGPVDPSLFPRSVGDLLDDPFRSLAYLVRLNNGFRVLHLPFQEFYWANYFRTHLESDLLAARNIDAQDARWCDLRPYSTVCLPMSVQKSTLYALLDRALELAHSPEAAELPGYIPLDRASPSVAMQLPLVSDSSNVDAAEHQPAQARATQNNHTKRELAPDTQQPQAQPPLFGVAFASE